MLTTPQRVTAEIRRLCRKIGNLQEPTFVDVQPRSDSQPDDCFMDVQRQVETSGGMIQHGWLLWEWPGICAEAVFHAVWSKPDGTFLDVSHKEDAETRILFARDLMRVFSGTRVHTIRMAVGRDPRIARWIEMHNRLDRMVAKQMKGIPFGKKFNLSAEAADLRRCAHELSVELANCRDALRADRRVPEHMRTG